MPNDTPKLEMVRVSEASRNDARGNKSRGEIDQAINKLNEDRQKLIARKLQIQELLSRFAARGGHHVTERANLVYEKDQIEIKLSGVKLSLTQLGRDLALLGMDNREKKSIYNGVVFAKMLEELIEIKSLLKEIVGNANGKEKVSE